MKRAYFSFLVAFVVVFFVDVAQAATVLTNPQNAPLFTTGTKWLDAVLGMLGAVWAFLSFLANTLPTSWEVTKVLARIATDIRGVTENEKFLRELELILEEVGKTMTPAAKEELKKAFAAFLDSEKKKDSQK